MNRGNVRDCLSKRGRFRWLAMLLPALCLLAFVCFSPLEASACRSGVWEYTVSDGEATLIDYFGSSLDITIPEKIDGYPVTGIGDRLFCGSRITSLYISKNIEEIGISAFADCRYLSEIFYDAEDAKAAPDGVFRNAGKACRTLLVTFGKSVKTIPDHLFDPCGNPKDYARVTDVVMSDSVEEIDDFVFYQCVYLKNLSLGKGVQEIGQQSFYNCQSLTMLTIPKNVTQIESYAFGNCKNLGRILFNAVNCKVSPNGCFANAGAKSGSVTVIFGDGVKYIPKYAFYEKSADEYSRVTKVTIPSSVKGIGAYVFDKCRNLKTVTVLSKNCTFPQNSSNNSQSAFRYCPKSAAFKVYKGSTAEKFAKKYGFQHMYLNGKVHISLDKRKASIPAGSTLKLKASVSGGSGKITWKSSNPAVAAIDGNGKITAKKGGTAVISVTFLNTTVKCTVGVYGRGAVAHNGHHYKIYPNYARTWTVSNKACKDSGGHLVTISSNGEENFVKNMAVKGRKNAYWIGLYCTGGKWKWSDGETFRKPTFWAKGEPSRQNSAENYVMMYGKDHKNAKAGQWNNTTNNGGKDFFALKNIGYICEWDF